MVKFIQLKLLKVKYNGDSIGDDIRVEIEILSKFLRIDKTIKVGETAEINQTNQEIGNFETDRDIFIAGLRATIIEKDLLFNDVGSMDSDIKVNTSTTKLQQFVYKVQLREVRSVLGKTWGKKTAIFEITLEANVRDAAWYISDEGDGWLKVKFANGNVVSLPAYLKLKFERIDNGREYFTISEGAYRGEFASAKLKDDGSSNLIFGVQHGSEARASYSISKKTFNLNGKTYMTVDYKNAPWEKGLYDIEIPDYPHGRNDQYAEAVRQKIWFKIGHGGERYLHVGSRSLGCMTIIETKHWMEIYNTLIKARKGDFMSVGVLEVID